MFTLLQIADFLLTLVGYAILAQVILSWLVAFNVINLHNEFVRSVYLALEKILEPLYRPIRRVMPDFGQLDLSPLVVLLVIQILQRFVIPNAQMALLR